jgi:hypothetical protein
VIRLVDVRCKNFNDILWAYVVENANRREITRCEALQEIVKEHMRFLVEAQKERMVRVEGAEKEER